KSTWQFREVSSQNSFNGHNSLFVHIGLGDAEQIDTLMIDWPSGHKDVFQGLEPDRFVSIIEGETPTVVSGESDAPSSGNVILDMNYPNPFRDNTTVAFDLPRTMTVRLEVVDQLGRVVGIPVHGTMTAGRHRVNVSTLEWSSGVYLYRLSAGGKTLSRPLTIIQ
ncbi:ASPIC/UnbV domain-containing protein, partial [Bacteroidota bacterium]